MKADEFNLLAEVILKRVPPVEQANLIAAVQANRLTQKQRNWLIDDILAIELMDTGFREDDEPNQRGLQLENLISLINGPNLV